MGIKVTLGEVLVARDAILKFEKLPGKLSYKLGVLAADLHDQAVILNNVRNDLIKKYGTPDEKTGQPSIQQNTPEMKQFSEEYAEVLNQEVEIKLEEKIVIPSSISLEPSMVFNLRKFIEVA